ADHRHAGVAIDGLPLRVLGHEALVARRLDVAGDLCDGVVPADVLPFVRAGLAHFRPRQPVGVRYVLFERDPLGAETPAADRMIRIPFDVDDGAFDVLGLVPEGVDDDAAGNRAVGADA